VINVDSLLEGVVIDHIQSGAGYKIFYQLGLDKTDSVVLLMRNVPSEKMGRKDMIKIETGEPVDLKILGLIDPHATVNIVKEGKIQNKVKLKLPEEVIGILKCRNPRCVTHAEGLEKPRFFLYDGAKRLYKCEYCDSVTGL
jgi:aspartate carbamoyltransferase regulatory subunit